MQSVKHGLVAAAMVCALSASAQSADCTRFTTLGETLTHDTSVLFSTNALKKFTRCAGSRGERAGAHDLRNRLDDDVSLLADGLQRRNAQD
jgi:hypothetical protein